MVIRQQEHRADARSAIPPGPEGIEIAGGRFLRRSLNNLLIKRVFHGKLALLPL